MKRLSLVVFVLLLTSLGFAQQKEYQLSTHILDVSEGLPAQQVSIKLEKLNIDNKTWSFVAENKTNKDGRIGNFLPSKNDNVGIYRC